MKVSTMSTKTIAPELLQQLQRDRELIAAELPELTERHARMGEAKSENTFSGHLRQAIHRSGRLIREIAADAGITSEQLGDFLEGSHTLRSDVLDRLAQAVGATITIEPTRPRRPEAQPVPAKTA
jgi:DNA-binding phage protein